MSDLSTAILSHPTDRDLRDEQIYAVLGLTAPGAIAVREADGRLMVWASEQDSEDDDGQAATYRSRQPITDAEWSEIGRLAYIESAEQY